MCIESIGLNYNSYQNLCNCCVWLYRCMIIHSHRDNRTHVQVGIYEV